MPNNLDEICLKHDNGEELRFNGRLFSECSWFDEDSGVLTRQQLYTAAGGGQVYYVIRSRGREDRTRHAYRISLRDDACTINNGRTEMTLNIDLLMLAVRGLCGFSKDAAPSRDMVEEMLRAANA